LSFYNEKIIPSPYGSIEEHPAVSSASVKKLIIFPSSKSFQHVVTRIFGWFPLTKLTYFWKYHGVSLGNDFHINPWISHLNPWNLTSQSFAPHSYHVSSAGQQV